MGKMIDVQNLKKEYVAEEAVTNALQGVTFGIEKGEFVVSIFTEMTFIHFIPIPYTIVYSNPLFDHNWHSTNL